MIKEFRGKLLAVMDGKNNNDVLHIALEQGKGRGINDEDWIRIFARKGDAKNWKIGTARYFRANVRRLERTRLAKIVFMSLKKEKVFINELWKKEGNHEIG